MRGQATACPRLFSPRLALLSSGQVARPLPEPWRVAQPVASIGPSLAAIVDARRSSPRNRGFGDGDQLVGSAGWRESAILLPDPMQQVVNGIAAQPLVDGCGNGGREGANDKGDGGDI